MSSSLLAFLTVLERCLQPILPTGGEWRFQRLINFPTEEATLQLWEGERMQGQVEVRRTSQSDGSATLAGSVQSSGGEGAAGRKVFTFRPSSVAEVERQAQSVADWWRQSLPGANGEDARPTTGEDS